jgi:hypothetical protein
VETITGGIWMEKGREGKGRVPRAPRLIVVEGWAGLGWTAQVPWLAGWAAEGPVTVKRLGLEENRD